MKEPQQPTPASSFQWSRILTHPITVVLALWAFVPLGIGLFLMNPVIRKDRRWWAGVAVWIVFLFIAGRWSSQQSLEATTEDVLVAKDASPVVGQKNENGLIATGGQKVNTRPDAQQHSDEIRESLLRDLLSSGNYSLLSSKSDRLALRRVSVGKYVLGSDLEWLPMFPSIETLWIQNIRGVDPSYAMRLPNLQRLSLGEITPADVTHLAECCPELNTFVFQKELKTPFKEYILPLSKLKNLRVLVVTLIGGKPVQIELPDNAWASLGSLDRLVLRGKGRPLDARAAAYFLQTVRHDRLRQLSLSAQQGASRSIDGSAPVLAGIAERCPRLTELSIGGLLQQVVERELNDLKAMRDLQHLFGDIGGSRRQSDESRIKLKQQLPGVWKEGERPRDFSFSIFFEDTDPQCRPLQQGRAQGTVCFMGDDEEEEPGLTPDQIFENGFAAGARFAAIQKTNVANGANKEHLMSNVIEPTVGKWEDAFLQAKNQNNLVAEKHFGGLVAGFWSSWGSEKF